MDPNDPDYHLDPRELAEQSRRLQHAADEKSATGALRRAIHAGRKELPELARIAQISVFQLDDFLQGQADLTTGQFDILVATLKLRILEVA